MYKLIGLAALLVAGPALAQKVNIDYAKDMDFKDVKTFQYIQKEDSGVKDSLMADHITQMLKAKLTASGLSEVTANPDIYVTYHVTTKTTPVLNTTGFGYGGFGPGWGAWGGGLSSATTTVSEYTTGTLVVDAYGPDDKKLVWRGTGTVDVSDKPDKVTKQVQDILDKLGDRWQKILKNQGE
jgi:Domain of unknown function (DUF4136)